MRIKVKICGITRAEDAETAVQAGADLLGFVFYDQSPRYLPLDSAARITGLVPPSVLRVGLFVNPDARWVAEAITRCGLQMLQFHGDESPAFTRQFGVMTMKAFRVKGAETLDLLPHYPADAWLLDAHVQGKFGGTGHTFDWSVAAKATQLGRPVFLAGGLTPENVREAVRRVHPYGVDVSGGVEAAPGRKDPDKVRAFISAARHAAETVD